MSQRWGLWLALAIYLPLAFSGIHYGLPHENHLMSYNCDETTWLDALSRIRRHKLNPAPELITPTFYLELYAASILAGGMTGWIPLHENKEWFRTHPDIFGRFFLAGRMLQIICAILLLWGLWEWGRMMGGTSVATMATLLLAASPSLAAASHFSQANIPVTLLTFGALFCLWKDEQTSGATPRWLWMGAFLSGLAISTKYSALPMLLAVAWQSRNWWRRPRVIVGALMAVVVGLFCGTPFAFLAPRTFFSAFLELKEANLMPVTESISQKLLFPFMFPLRNAMGTAFLLSGLAGLIGRSFRTKGKDSLVLWVIGFYVGTCAAGHIASSGRVLIVLPAFALLAATLFAFIGQPFRSQFTVALFLLVWGLTLPYSMAIASLHARPLNQTKASLWIEEHIPAGSSIGIPRSIFWWTPATIYASAHHPERVKNPYRVIDLHFSKENAQREAADYILLSGAERSNEALKTPQAREFLAWLDSGSAYELVQSFPRELYAGPWRWNRPEEPLYTDDDLWSPSEELYQRKSPPVTPRRLS